MKKLTIPLILLSLIVVFCVWSTCRVDAICREAAGLLDQAETKCLLGDYDGAEELALASQGLWLDHEGFLGMALRHTESDDVAILYAPLLETCRQKDGDEFQIRSLELRATLRQLSRMEFPHYFNVL